ncbi:hypothetical protein HY490_00140 [Candidatus Woesearchaeota archaeon]|nr:hypothetical protein [Candidatus Woesearchaeota archaeon]
MSEVTLILVHGDDMHSLTAHWRDIKALLLKHPMPKGSAQVDAGYIIVDFNRGFIVDAQQAFKLHEIKGFEVVRL